MSRTNPNVSVIIPVYNAEEHLHECLDSAVGQTLRDIEIICVDDGSTDSSLKILREYEEKDARVHVLTQENMFAGTARNRGMDAARGTYFAFLDADDFYLPDALERMLALTTKYDLDFLKASFYYLEEGKEPYDTTFSTNGFLNKKLFHKVLSMPENLKVFNSISDVAWNGLYKASFLNEHNIRFNHFRAVNDHSFYIECVLHAKRIMATDLHVACYRINQPKSLIGTKSRYFQCEIDNYYRIRNTVEGLPFEQRRVFLSREINSVFHWYNKLYDSAEPFYKEQMDRQLRSFVSSFDENDVGIKHLLKMPYRDLYYKIKKELLPEGTDPQFPCTVSIIIPVYNAETYLDACLESVCNQTFREMEVVCVDDHSTDGGLAVLRKWADRDPRVKVIAHEKNKGRGGARNTGLNAARGKYVWFLDAEDRVDPDAVEMLVSKMEELKEADLITFHAAALEDGENGQKDPDREKTAHSRHKNQMFKLPRDAERIPPEIEESACAFLSKRTFLDAFRFREEALLVDTDFIFALITTPVTFYEMDYAPCRRRIHEAPLTGQSAGVYDRLLTAREISRILREKGLKETHFAAIWAKRWLSTAIALYEKRSDLHNDSCNRLVKEIQKEAIPLSSRKIMGSPVLRPLFIPEVVVSLTSCPERIADVYTVVAALIGQTVHPDRILLYLAEEQFADHIIPAGLEELRTRCTYFEVCFCGEDLKTHNRYFHAMQEYPDAIVITVDDGVLYHDTLLEELIDAYLRHPDAVSAVWGHTIALKGLDEFAPFDEWKSTRKRIHSPSLLTLPVGVGGCLYPPHVLPPQTFDTVKIKSVCPVQDDLWLKWNLLKRRVNCVVLKQSISDDRAAGAQKETTQNADSQTMDSTWKRIAAFDDGLTENGEPITLLLFDSYMREIVTEEKQRADKLQYDLDCVHNSVSFRIGRRITWLPRKARGLVRCCREHDAKYTFERILYHLHLGPDNEKE